MGFESRAGRTTNRTQSTNARFVRFVRFVVGASAARGPREKPVLASGVATDAYADSVVVMVNVYVNVSPPSTMRFQTSFWGVVSDGSGSNSALTRR